MGLNGTYSPICNVDLAPLTRHFKGTDISPSRTAYFSCPRCGAVVASVDGRAVRNLREVK